MGNITETHNQGDVTFSRIGSTSETYMGTKTSAKFSAEAHISSGGATNNFVGGYVNITAAAAQETFMEAKMAIHSGPIVENSKSELGKKEVSIDQVKTAIKKVKMYVVNSTMTMIG